MHGVTFEPENVDLAELASELRRVFAGRRPVGYLLGRTALRDAVVNVLSCSQLQAEEIVDTMIARDFLKYEGDPAEEIDDDLRSWRISPYPGLS
jgi:hypothetical protein